VKIEKDDDIFEKGFKAGAGGFLGILSVIGAINFIAWFVPLFFIGVLVLIGISSELVNEFPKQEIRTKINICRTYLRRGENRNILIGYEYNEDVWKVLGLRKNQKINQIQLVGKCKNFIKKMERKIN